MTNAQAVRMLRHFSNASLETATACPLGAGAFSLACYLLLLVSLYVRCNVM